MDTAIINAPKEWTDEQVDLIKRTVARGATDDELQMFLHVARTVGLDPFTRQIHAVKRWDNDSRREVMAIQVGIDGLRAVADRTGCYAPGQATTFQYDEQSGQPIAATAYVKKLVAGTWHEIAETAHYDEYVGKKKDGTPTAMWRKRHIMLAKCAEARALRRAFPQQLSGLYSHEEMEQAGEPRDVTIIDGHEQAAAAEAPRAPVGRGKPKAASARQESTASTSPPKGRVVDLPPTPRSVESLPASQADIIQAGRQHFKLAGNPNVPATLKDRLMMAATAHAVLSPAIKEQSARESWMVDYAGRSLGKDLKEDAISVGDCIEIVRAAFEEAQAHLSQDDAFETAR